MPIFLRRQSQSKCAPSINSITSTRLVGESRTLGTQMSLNLFYSRKVLVLCILANYLLKSSSSRMFFQNYSINQLYLNYANSFLARYANPRSNFRSPYTWLDNSRCCTFTATFQPFSSWPRCTCAMEAEEIGFSSILRNTTSIGQPRSYSIVALICSKEETLHSRVKLFITSRYQLGTITSKVAMICPNFRQMPPFFLSASRRYQLAFWFLSSMGSCWYLQMQVICAPAQSRLQTLRKEWFQLYWQQPVEASPSIDRPKMLLIFTITNIKINHKVGITRFQTDFTSEILLSLDDNLPQIQLVDDCSL